MNAYIRDEFERNIIMNDDFLRFVSRFPSLTKEEAKEIAEVIPVHTYEKGKILLRQGEVATKCYFILKGCIRRFHLINGEEVTTAVYTEEQAVVPFSSYNNQEPSDHFLVCVEEITTVVGDIHTEEDMYQKYPKLLSITRDLMAKDFGKNQEELAKFIASSPEERYLNILENRPELFQRVPHHQIASYIGIAPESLSRIKKRVVKNKTERIN